jgi:ribosome-binding factor A
VIGDKKQYPAILVTLEERRRDLQYQLSRRVILKFTPQLHFKINDSVERGIRVNNILDELNIPPDETPETDPDEQG